jgi:hypothetical protein
MILTPLGFIKYDVHATCLVYYLFFLDRQFRGDVAILVFLKTMASYNPTSWTPSLFTEVPVLSQESEQSCICVLSNIEFVYFYDFSIEFLELFRQCDIFFPFYYRLWTKNYDDVPATGRPKEILQSGTILLWGLRTGWNFSQNCGFELKI